MFTYSNSHFYIRDGFFKFPNVEVHMSLKKWPFLKIIIIDDTNGLLENIVA